MSINNKVKRYEEQITEHDIRSARIRYIDGEATKYDLALDKLGKTRCRLSRANVPEEIENQIQKMLCFMDKKLSERETTEYKLWIVNAVNSVANSTIDHYKDKGGKGDAFRE